MAQVEMKLPTRVEIALPGTAAARITQELFFVPKPDKPRLLEKIIGEYRGSVLVFSRTKHGAKRIAKHLRTVGHAAAEIHSNKSLNQRKEALEGFRNGKYRILVATDIASRGIDVKGIELVLNYDLPDDSSDYVHRIGRTGRAGGAGHAISFATPDQKRDVRDIEHLLKAVLPISQLPQDLPPMRARAPFEREPMARRPFRPHGPGGYGGSRSHSSGPRRFGGRR
jgi:ATP-dependent RNA helicase RhlE